MVDLRPGRGHPGLVNELLRLQALCAIQTADISSLLKCVQVIGQHLRLLDPGLPDLNAQFLTERKMLLHNQLENLEKTNPALAARMQDAIDKSCWLYPFDY